MPLPIRKGGTKPKGLKAPLQCEAKSTHLAVRRGHICASSALKPTIGTALTAKKASRPLLCLVPGSHLCRLQKQSSRKAAQSLKRAKGQSCPERAPLTNSQQGEHAEEHRAASYGLRLPCWTDIRYAQKLCSAQMANTTKVSPGRVNTISGSISVKMLGWLLRRGVRSARQRFIYGHDAHQENVSRRRQNVFPIQTEGISATSLLGLPRWSPRRLQWTRPRGHVPKETEGGLTSSKGGSEVRSHPRSMRSAAPLSTRGCRRSRVPQTVTWRPALLFQRSSTCLSYPRDHVWNSNHPRENLATC